MKKIISMALKVLVWAIRICIIADLIFTIYCGVYLWSHSPVSSQTLAGLKYQLEHFHFQATGGIVGSILVFILIIFWAIVSVISDEYDKSIRKDTQ